MPPWLPNRQLERSDRYVQRCHVRGGVHASRTRMTFCIEEALRLISLPGENEGRIYFFRRVLVADVSARASLQEWTNACQAALHELAVRAIHGNDHRAASADAVYFHNHQEGLESLLARTIHREPADQWFWPQLSGIAIDATRAEKVLAIVQMLNELAGSWLAVADSVITAVGSGDPLALSTMLPLPTVNHWLQELAPKQNVLTHPRPVHLQKTVADMLLRSVKALGTADPRTVWLASLAVVRAVPSELTEGAVVSRARATLRHLAEDGRELHHDSATRNKESVSAGQTDLDETVYGALPPQPKVRPFAVQPRHMGLQFEQVQPELADYAAKVSPAGLERKKAFENELATQGAPTNEAMKATSSAPNVYKGSELNTAQPTLTGRANVDALHEPGSLVVGDQVSLGEPTHAAGLYFLLNALRRLGIAEVLAAHPAAAEQGLVAQIMKRLALHARVDARDAVWRWINSSLAQAASADTTILANAKLFPSNLRPSSREVFDAYYLSRVWCVAVRRWCWYSAGIKVHEVVNRDGLVSLNRTDLDVTLPLSSAEFRIRRAGLDVDPGWLPWFGKVVRFHYVWDDGAHVH